MDRLKPWQQAIAALAILKVVLGVGLFAAALISETAPLAPRDLLMAVHVAVYGGVAALLLTVGRRDLRATVLGIAFLLTAAVFADNGLKLFTPASIAQKTALRAFFALQVDAFSAYFLWFFVKEFPRIASFGPRNRVPRLAMSASNAVGTALFVVNAAYFVAATYAPLSPMRSALGVFARGNDHGLYWPLQYMLSVPALGVLVWKSRVASVTESRRVSILITGLVVGVAPTTCWVLLASISPWFRSVVPLRHAGWVLYPTLLSTPFTTAYAVLVHQALNARLIIRRAIQYAFARYSVLLAASIPFLVLVLTLYRQRQRSMAELAGGRIAVVLVGLALVAFLASRASRGLLERLDRRFFREQYDARQILEALVDKCRRATSRFELVESLRTEIDRALHPTSLAVLFLDQSQTSFVTPGFAVRPLPAESEITRLLHSSTGALDVDLERPDGVARRLSTSDRYWIADAGARLLLPVKRADRKVIGALVLGEKRSELPYSDEDKLLLSTVASATALSLAYPSSSPEAAESGRYADADWSGGEPAAICMACSRLDDPGVRVCVRCGAPMARAAIPSMVAGKFRVIELIGEGGMGVVYRGLDLALDRDVAIKTLPKVSPGEASRLRREARVMAAITHPNLALIYGAESWRGTPILIVEFLAGGTLATRLRSGPLPVNQALGLGIALAEVVDSLHRAGILHGDIKPSNIGFAADRTPKLLDFGLARLLSGTAVAGRVVISDTVSTASLSTLDGDAEGRLATTSVEGQIIGTPLYMSPEALAGRSPNPTFDLWSISIVLFEAIAGTHPAQDVSLVKTLQRIENCSLPDLRELLPEADPELAAFFHAAFSPEPANRPRSAGALREQLTALRQRSGPSARAALTPI